MGRHPYHRCLATYIGGLFALDPLAVVVFLVVFVVTFFATVLITSYVLDRWF